MKKLGVRALVVAVVLVCHNDMGAARGHAVEAAKKRGVELLERWRQGFRETQKVKVLLQHVGMVAALCTAVACSSKQQQQSEPLNMLPPAIRSEAEARVATRIEGYGDDAVKVLDRRSVAAYLQNRNELSVNFYDKMIVHYRKDGGEYVRIVDSVDGATLRVRHELSHIQDEVEIATIEGVVIDEHQDYGVSYAFPIEYTRSINDDGGDEVLAELRSANWPADLLLYGRANMIFTDGSYAMVLTHILLPDGGALVTPSDPLFLVDAEHLVIVDIEDTKQQHSPGGIERQSPDSDQHLLVNALLD